MNAKANPKHAHECAERIMQHFKGQYVYGNEKELDYEISVVAQAYLELLKSVKGGSDGNHA